MKMMTTEAILSVEQRIRQLLEHLGIDQAHFAGRVPADWMGLAATYPELLSSLTLIGPLSLDPSAASQLASKLLVFNADQRPAAEQVRRVVENVPGAQLVTLRDYPIFGWTDVLADRTGEVGNTMLSFLAQTNLAGSVKSVPLPAGEGEIAGISYRIRGAGPPLVLLPLMMSASQWEPLIPRLSEQYCTITLGGADLGSVAIMESRGRAAGFVQMLRSLMTEAQLQPGETVLDVGCGTGVLDRWLAQHMGKAHHAIRSVDINRYLLQEASALARKEELEGAIEFREGNAEALLFPDNSFDVALSVTVIEEVDADRMLAEMVRVTKPGGRVVVISRALDMPFLTPMRLSAGLQTKVGAPGALRGMTARGCADASLYQRIRQAGLSKVKRLPQLAPFDSADVMFFQFIEQTIVSTLNQEEASEWRAARAQSGDDFFIAWPHHCAVGIKPA